MHQGLRLMPFIPGTALGSYEVTARIGESGIVSVVANVWSWPRLCEKTKLQKSVVIENCFTLGKRPKWGLKAPVLTDTFPKWCAVPLASKSRAFSHSLGQ